MLPIETVLITTAVILLSILFATRFKSKRKLAPGPIIWPLIGNVIEIKLADRKYPDLALAKMAKKYGNVMGLGMGSTYTVVVSGYQEMKEIFTKPETYESRFPYPFVPDRAFNKSLGIIWSHGEDWRDIRAFTRRSMRNFGFGKKASMEALLNEETDVIMKHIQNLALKNSGIWFVDHRLLSTFSLNTLWSFVGGYRFNHDDQVVQENLELNDRLIRIVGQNNIYNAYPILKDICPKLVEHDLHMQTHRDIQAWIKGLIGETKQRRSERLDHEAQSFIEVFVDEIEKNRDTISSYTDEQLIVLLMDMFLAGSETSSTSITWIILFLTLNPECQQKLRLEIQEAKTKLEKLTIQTIGKLPYMTAVVLEVSRIGNFIPLPAPRMASDDIHWDDFVIPKGTALIYNYAPIFMDKDFWGDPEVFRPERFLNTTGRIIPQLADRMAIFGFGKRECFGKSLAWDTMVTFTMKFVTTFTSEPIEGNEPSAKNPVSGATYKPRKFSVRIVPVGECNNN